MNEIRADQVERHYRGLITQIVTNESEYILSQPQGQDSGPQKKKKKSKTAFVLLPICQHLQWQLAG